jgi:hypothetical protein
MKLLRYIPIYAIAAALVVVPSASTAQKDQAAENTSKPKKHAKNKLKNTDEKAATTSSEASTKHKEKAATTSSEASTKHKEKAATTTAEASTKHHKGKKAAADTGTSGTVASTKSESRTSGSSHRARTTGSAARSASPVSDADIAAAKSSGKVWVNTESGVYHKGGQWYGATSQGKFMTEEDAKKAGYHMAKGK